MNILPYDGGDKEITIETDSGLRIYVDYDDVDHIEAEYTAHLIELLPALIESIKSDRGAEFLRMALRELEQAKGKSYESLER